MDMEKINEDIVKEAEETLNSGNDKGHDELMDDVKLLLNEALSFEFHDFLNEAYDSPKQELVKFLTRMIEKTKEGKYDN